MATNIKCPNCATVFDVENVLSADVEQKLKQRYEKQLQESLSQINSDKKKLEEDQRAFEEKKKRENSRFSLFKYEKPCVWENRQKQEREKRNKKYFTLHFQKQKRRIVSSPVPTVQRSSDSERGRGF